MLDLAAAAAASLLLVNIVFLCIYRLVMTVLLNVIGYRGICVDCGSEEKRGCK